MENTEQEKDIEQNLNVTLELEKESQEQEQELEQERIMKENAEKAREKLAKEFDILFDKKKQEELDLARKNKETYIAYNDPEFEFAKELKIERDKRHQAQIYTEYYLRQLTYFDFFSKSSFDIVRRAKAIALSYNHKTITSDALFLAFFDGPTAIRRILKESNVTRGTVEGNLHLVLVNNQYKPKFRIIRETLMLINPFEKKEIKREVKERAKEFWFQKKKKNKKKY